MIIASWNVNSIKQRLEHVKSWLGENKPDVLLIQELKGSEFPSEAFSGAGYHSAYVSQKGNNGVAVIASKDFEVIHESLPENEEDDQARYLEIDYHGQRIINIYAPNGNPPDSDKYKYKLRWMKYFEAHLAELLTRRISFIAGGDFNIIPEEKDCYDPKAWEGDALFKSESRQIYRRLLNTGLTDAFRVFHSDGGNYTFWDYQAGAWPQDYGIRIDHFLCSPECADKLKNCWIDKSLRGLEKPSDHTVIAIEISDPV